MAQNFEGLNSFDVQLWAEGISPLGVEQITPQAFEHIWWPDCELNIAQATISSETSIGIHGLINVLGEHNATRQSSTDGSSPTLDVQRSESRRDKRLRQNRAAQRAFRARRDSRMSDLLDEVSAANAQLRHLETENKELADSLRDAQTEIRSLRSLVPQTLASQHSQRHRPIEASMDGVGEVVVLRLDLTQIR